MNAANKRHRNEIVGALMQDVGSVVVKEGQRQSKHTITLFMCRATCARCWYILFELAYLRRWLVQHDTKVVVIVAARNLESARNLAREWDLPFTFIPATFPVPLTDADPGSTSGNHCWALVLTDHSGVVRYRLEGVTTHDLLNHAALRAMVECVSITERSYTAPRCPKTQLTQYS